MKLSVELRYCVLFIFSLIVTVLALVVSINKLQPLLFQRIFSSCTAAYQSITANAVIISTVFVIGLLLLFVSLSLKLILSGYRTSRSLSKISNKAQKNFPSALSKIIKRLGLSRNLFIITNHAKPLAVTVGMFDPKVILSKNLINQLTEKELEAVVLHELYHQQHKHGLLFIMAEAIAASLIAVVPILKDVIKNMKRDFELLADDHAASYQKETIYISRALTKLSGNAIVTPFPSFATILDERLERLHDKPAQLASLSLKKLLFSVCMIMALSFFAAMPITSANTVIYAEQPDSCEIGQNCSNVCVSRFSVGMSKLQNSSSILPASVF